MSVEYKRVSLSELHEDPANARLHPEENLADIRASLKEFGQVEPLVIQKASSKVIGGNGRLKVMRELGWNECDVAVVDFDNMKATALGIALNRAGERAEWDKETLDKLLAEIGDVNEELEQSFKELEDEVGIVEAAGDSDAEPQINRAAELQKKWGTAQGQLWLIGEHRLLCGDSTKREDVERVMGGERAGLCFTSPPYAQQRDYKEKSENASDWDSLMCGVFANLPMADDGQVLVNLGIVHRDGEWWPYWDGWIEWMRGQGWKRFGWYVWDQINGLPGDWNGRLAPSHEFIFHFNRSAIRPDKFVGTKPASQEKRKQCRARAAAGEFVPGMRDKDGTVREISSPSTQGQTHKIPDSVIRIGRNVANDIARQNHPATFPKEFPEFAMNCWDGIVYEPFSGSGTTFVAAQNLNRKCYGIEISPAYCAVILERMQTAFPALEIRQA